MESSKTIFLGDTGQGRADPGNLASQYARSYAAEAAGAAPGFAVSRCMHIAADQALAEILALEQGIEDE